MSACTSRLLKSTLAAGLAAITFLTGLPPSMAADHGDAPFASVKRSETSTTSTCSWTRTTTAAWS